MVSSQGEFKWSNEKRPDIRAFYGDKQLSRQYQSSDAAFLYFSSSITFS